MDSRALRGNLLLLVTSAIWGFGFIAQQFGSRALPPFSFNACRFALGSASLLPLIVIFGWHDPARRRARAASRRLSVQGGLLNGGVMFLGAWLQQAGIAETTAGQAAFLTGLYILFVPLLGLFMHHRVPLTTWCAGILALVGLYLLSVREDLSVSRGDVFEIAGAVFWALHILCIDAYVKRTDPLEFSFWQFAFCALFSVGTALSLEPGGFAHVGDALLPILYCGVVSVGIAYTLQVVAQKDVIPAHAALILSVETVFATLGGAVVLGENLGLRGYVGCVLMFSGMILAQWHGLRGGMRPADVRT
ncbi:DMT family transporter [Fretibacterium fastidiosum]|uniref:Permeases of the drug/metabolite transporter (DMT) superfamily n=1 Tax=Fretibacterium fastidiosum TaxID=651822 RepID=A0AB94IVT5_9BACT|nr:DMT family transporter [Fretibacterium fastidiosum]CBL27841.1 Permeases of the drug/metabolite transporter (DMT) superfamily [Fretibacterium fastidiosum]